MLEPLRDRHAVRWNVHAGIAVAQQPPQLRASFRPRAPERDRIALAADPVAQPPRILAARGDRAIAPYASTHDLSPLGVAFGLTIDKADDAAWLC